MRLSKGLRDGRVHQLVRDAKGCATTGAKQVRHRGFDKRICAVDRAKKGSSSKHLSYLRVSVFLTCKWSHFVRHWFFLSRKPT